jgi:hypothetical protein
MNAVTEGVKKSKAEQALRCLAEGLDTPKMDEFLDQLLALVHEFGQVSFYLTGDDRILVLYSKDLLLAQLETSRPKTKIRILCARLAVRCGEWSGREVFPYGDTLEVDHPDTKQIFKIQFENTPAAQTVTIDIVSANGTSENGRETHVSAE